MIRVLPSDALRRMPWKNGRGTTLEIASDSPAPGEPWTWRFSVADVPESGPFSRFEGCERLIGCVDGRGMRLVIDDAAPRDVPAAGPGLRFSGEANTIGHLIDGPVRDANLMYARHLWRGELEVLRDAASRRIERFGSAMVYAVTGQAVVRSGRDERTIEAGQAAIVTSVEVLVTAAADAVIVSASLEATGGRLANEGQGASAPPASSR
ncbi:MAG: HutD family protein [Phycisphaerae bacterium]|nr:HutD family protein [Phycisphaerae bacterium]